MKPSSWFRPIGLCASLLLVQVLTLPAAEARSTISLDGRWLFQTNGAPVDRWKQVNIPSTFQSHEGIGFHGIGWYRRALRPPQIPAGKRLLLHFQAAATEAEVWWNGERLGDHLGGWTPFRFDVTDFVRKTPPGVQHELKVRLDEKPGHSTQGFLPVIAPHFGGLWQEVGLLIVPETYLDDLRLLSYGDLKTGELVVQVPLAGRLDGCVTGFGLACREGGHQVWQRLTTQAELTGTTLKLRATVAEPKPWSPASPTLYEVRVGLPGRDGDRLITRAAFRSIAAAGAQVQLNGQPLSVRGLLNWGYSPPLLEPNPGEATWRRELELARDRGFNLMKFCLWIPPQRYLELADEMGMLTWMEYPTWHPDFSEKHLDPLRQEFSEFFAYDRNHPSVILRSLTCETGPSADLKVIQSLYDTAHAMIPSALVEDDSSWISWNRVHDFYDDHPYGNNHTWVKTLKGLTDHVAARTNKPLLLGEAIAADTWLDREPLLEDFHDKRPWWTPGPLDATGTWLDQMTVHTGRADSAQLLADSLHYALLMRKYQVEAYRREVPDGGYVVSVIRDIPKASMGLVDYLGRAKWSAADWVWHGPTMLLLKTANDRRSFSAQELLQAELLLTHFGAADVAGGELEMSLYAPGAAPGKGWIHRQQGLRAEASRVSPLAKLDWPMPDTVTPRQFILRAELRTKTAQWRNEWPLWVVPSPAVDASGDYPQLHKSLSPALAQELFPQGTVFDPEKPSALVVASRFDDSLAACLENGGRVLLLPDGERHSLPLSSHWFLRGAPYVPPHPVTRDLPRNLFIELQHFDLAARVVPSLPQFDQLDPILLLWDTHDLDTVRTHGLVFETRAGRGRLLVSALRHHGPDNAAGKWFLSCLLEHLRAPQAGGRALRPEVWDYLKTRLHIEQTNLVSREWEFRPDPQNEGVTNAWFEPEAATTFDWSPIKIGAWWESQGYEGLDRWAWYRLQVDIPPTGDSSGFWVGVT